ncbi:MAG: ABC transporter substrate-binding protein [Specibacter sp.]
MPLTTTPKRRGRHVLAAVSMLAAGSMLLAGCSSGGNTSKDAARFELTANSAKPSGSIDSFTWAIYAEPASLDYTHAFDYPDNQVLANVCESLMRWNSDLTVSPGLAEKFANPTPTTWVYQIRPNVKFHDGTTLSANDVVASLERHLNPEVGSYWSAVYENVTSIKATGPMEVTVTTKKPDALFNNYMAASPGTIESAATLKKDGANYGNPSTGVNCTGPFSLDSWNSGTGITLKKFNDYWDPALMAKANEVKFVFLPDSNARVNAMKSGAVDGSWQVPSNGIDQLKSSGQGQILFGTNTSVISEIVGNTGGVLGDVRVRKALLMALDRKGLVQAAEQGYGTVTNSLTTKSAWMGVKDDVVNGAFAGLNNYDYNLDAAKKLIAEAGAAGKPVTIVSSNITPGLAITAQAFGAAATSLGLKPTIQSVSPDKFTNLFSDPAARKGVDLFTTSWYLSITDPLDMYGVLRTGDFSNYGNWSNKDFDTTVSSALETMDVNARAAKSVEAQKIANAELPWLPLYETPNNVWLGNKITGLSPSINFLYFPWAATVGAK